MGRGAARSSDLTFPTLNWDPQDHIEAFVSIAGTHLVRLIQHSRIHHSISMRLQGVVRAGMGGSDMMGLIPLIGQSHVDLIVWRDEGYRAGQPCRRIWSVLASGISCSIGGFVDFQAQ